MTDAPPKEKKIKTEEEGMGPDASEGLPASCLLIFLKLPGEAPFSCFQVGQSQKKNVGTKAAIIISK